MIEITDQGILNKATDNKVDNKMVFACLSKKWQVSKDGSPTKARNIFIFGIIRLNSKEFEISLLKGYCLLYDNAILVHMIEPSFAIITTTNLTDAQKIIQTLINSDLAY
jgi:hypothetical protein